MSQFLIIRAGKTYRDAAIQFGEFDQNFMDSFSEYPKKHTIIDAQNTSDYSTYNMVSGIIITGALENVTDNHSWMLPLKQFILENYQNNTPILGVCFGHQIIADTLGGKVDFNTNGGEFGIEEITLKQPTNFFDFQLPNKFKAYLTHYQSVVSLPKNAISYAESIREQNQITYYGNQTWGLQFHPEFTQVLHTFYLNRMNKKTEHTTIEQDNKIKAFGSALLDAFLKHCENSALNTK